ncbi:MAG: twin-arginine translocation signal domain-containing protein [Planctomycetota bacterium]
MRSKRTQKTNTISRRQFLKKSAACAAGMALAGPVFVPARALGANAPGNRITIGMIGMGRQAFHSNLKSFLNSSDTRHMETRQRP